MQEKTKRRRSERLIDKYAKIRDLRGDGTPDCEEVKAECATSFAPIPQIPGVFDGSELLENFDIFQQNFPDLASSVAPLVRPHVHSDSRASSLINQPPAAAEKFITDSELWCEIERKVKKVCPLMLSFVAQMVRIEMSSNPKSLPGTTSVNTKASTTIDSLQNAHILCIKAAADERITCCAASSSVVGVGVADGAIFLFDLLLHQNRNPLSITELQVGYGRQDKCSRLKKKILQFHRQSVTIMRYAGHEERFFSTDNAGTISHWDALSGVLLRVFSTRLTFCADLALSWPNSSQNHQTLPAFISAYDDGAARLFCASSASYRRIFPHAFPVNKVSLLRDQFCATVAVGERVIRVWELAAGDVVRSMDRLDGECIALEFLDEGRIFAVTDAGSLYLFGIRAAAVLKRLSYWDVGGIVSQKKAAKEIHTIMLDFISRVDQDEFILGVSRSSGERKIFSLRVDGGNCGDMILVELADLDRIFASLVVLEPQPHNRRGARKVAKKAAPLSKLRLMGVSCGEASDYAFIVTV